MARHTTVYAMFAATAKAAGDHPFLIVPARADRDWHPDGVAYSYGETLREVERLRDLYAAAGYGHGHRVAILLENRPEFFFHYLALNAIGATPQDLLAILQAMKAAGALRADLEII